MSVSSLSSFRGLEFGLNGDRDFPGGSAGPVRARQRVQVYGLVRTKD